MTYLDFNSKETYFAARKIWSSDFQAAIKAIRAAKLQLKEAHRGLGPLGAYPWKGSSEEKEVWRKANDKVWAAHVTLKEARKQVEKLLLERDRMRVEAGRQMHANNPALSS